MLLSQVYYKRSKRSKTNIYMSLVIVLIILTVVQIWSNTIGLSIRYDLNTFQNQLSLLNNQNIKLQNIEAPEISLDQKLKNLISKMSIEEKVGQMFMWHIAGTSLSLEDTKFLQEVNAGNVIIMQDNVSANLSNFISQIQATNPKIPLLISIDQEGGIVKRIKEDPNIGPYYLSTKSDQEVCNTYANTSQILQTYSINTNLGSIGDIAWKKNSYIYQRSFGNNATAVSNKAMQSIICAKNILNTIKHFPGHGRTSDNSHKIVPQINISYAEWIQTDALPFATAINNNVDIVMIGHLSYPQIDTKSASLSPQWIHILRNELHFSGIVMTDDINMLTSAGIQPITALDLAIDAKNDMLLYAQNTTNAKLYYQHIIDRVKSKDIPITQIDQSVKRILTAKNKIKAFL